VIEIRLITKGIDNTVATAINSEVLIATGFFGIYYMSLLGKFGVILKYRTARSSKFALKSLIDYILSRHPCTGPFIAAYLSPLLECKQLYRSLFITFLSNLINSLLQEISQH